MSQEDNGESGLSRWSRLKRSQEMPAKTAETSPVESPPLESPPEDGALVPVPAPDSEAGSESGEEEAGEEEASEAVLDLPPVGSLTKDSDYTPFLAEGVPEALTRAALRKLWTSDPVLANLDGLNDYDEDFRIVDTVIDAVDKLAGGKGGKDSEDEKQSKESPESGETTTASKGDEEDSSELASESENEQEDTDIPVNEEGENGRSQHAAKLPDETAEEADEV